jgi:hypothetical protein
LEAEPRPRATRNWGSKLLYLTEQQDLVGQRQEILVQQSRYSETDAAELGRQEFRPSCSFLRFPKQETFSGSVSIHEFNAGSL